MIKRLFYTFFESLIRNIDGGLGHRIRYLYFKKRFRTCGKNVRIDIGVVFQNCENISVGDNVWFMPYSLITACTSDMKLDNRIVKEIVNKKFDTINPDSLVIGNEIQIGAYNIIHGYGGLIISDRVTTSARVSIYSFSHHPVDDEDLSKITYANSMVKTAEISCIKSPILIEKGVWLGIGVSVFGGVIGKNTFVKPNSVVYRDIEENCYAQGFPAKKINERFKLDY